MPPKSNPSNIFRKTLWFDHRETLDLTELYDLLQPRRVVSDNPRYRNGLYYSEKCGRDIQYESGLELEFIKLMENHPDVLFYWEQPVAVSYWRGRIKARTYPDFAVYLKSRRLVIVEVKILGEMLDHRVQAKTEGLMEFCSSRGFGLLLTDGKHTPADLLKGKVNRRLEKELLAAIEQNSIRKAQWAEIKERCDAKENELHRAIIRHKLKYKPFPLKLQRGNMSPVFRQVYFEKKRYDDIIPQWITPLRNLK